MLKKNIFLVIIIILLTIELLFRFALKNTFEGRFDYGFASGVGIEENKIGQVNFKRTAGRKFWPQSYSIQKEASIFRVFIIGDSIARGSSLESSYAKLVQNNLNQNSDTNFEIWNLSIPGYGAERKKLILEDVLKYQPDLVIIHSGTSNEFEDGRDFRLRTQYNGWHPQYWPMKSYLFRWLDEIQQQRIKPKLLSTDIRNQSLLSDIDDENIAAQNEDNIIKWKLSFHLQTQKTLETLKERNIPYLFIPRIVIAKDRTHIENDDLYDILSDLVDNKNLIDLKLDLKPYDLDKIFSGDRVHLTKQGHILLSTILKDRIKLIKENHFPTKN